MSAASTSNTISARGRTQGIENELVVKRKKKQTDIISLDDVRCSERLDGLLKSYIRRAA